MTNVFINYDGPEVRNSGLLFVECSEVNGRPAAQSKALFQRHAIRNSFKKSRAVVKHLHNDDDDTATEHSSALVTKTAPRSKRTRPRACTNPLATLYQNQERFPILDSHGGSEVHSWAVHDPRSKLAESSASISPYATVKDVISVCQWFFYGHQAGDDFSVGRCYFMDAAWDRARANELCMNVMAIYARRKELLLMGNTERNRRLYLDEKGTLIKQIQKRINQYGTNVDSHTLQGIYMLAYCHFQDSEFAAAEVHLQVLRNLQAVEKMPPLLWVTLSLGMDLRFSLYRQLPPIFGYYIHPDFRNEYPDEMASDPAARSLAKACSIRCPSTNGFDSIDNFEILLKLSRLYVAWPRIKNFSPPPYGYIYDLEYTLRVITPEISRFSNSSSTARCIELVLLNIQLHSWILIRFWVPIADATRMYVLKRAHMLLDMTPNLIPSWTSTGASLDSLLWVLATFSASSLDDQAQGALKTIGHLDTLVKHMSIGGSAELLYKLKKWPWVDHWHSERLATLWDDLIAYRDPDVDVELIPRPSFWWRINGPTRGPRSFGY